MDNDITLYEIPAGGNSNLIERVNLLGSIAPIESGITVTEATGYILQGGILRFMLIRCSRTGVANTLTLLINDSRFSMSSGFTNEYPHGYANMSNTGVSSVALKCYFNNSGSQLRISPAVAPSFNFNMPAGTYNVSMGIWYPISA